MKQNQCDYFDQNDVDSVGTLILYILYLLIILILIKYTYESTHKYWRKLQQDKIDFRINIGVLIALLFQSFYVLISIYEYFRDDFGKSVYYINIENSAEDFHLYKNTILTPTEHKFLWCPQNGIILYQTVESLMINLEFEAVFYCAFDDNVMADCKKMIHWLMNEDAMRQCSLTIIVFSKSDLDPPTLKRQIEDILQLYKMDSKQSRRVELVQFNSQTVPFDELIKDSITNKSQSA